MQKSNASLILAFKTSASTATPTLNVLMAIDVKVFNTVKIPIVCLNNAEKIFATIMQQRVEKKERLGSSYTFSF
jgi:hypothetical protein